jgi:hypothetical protein
MTKLVHMPAPQPRPHGRSDESLREVVRVDGCPDPGREDQIGLEPHRPDRQTLGGLPPPLLAQRSYGPHPNPEKASMGMKIHRLEVDPLTGPVVGRIFEMYLTGLGYRAIAHALIDQDVPSPSAHGPARNPHRSRHAWAGSAVPAILTNARYLGRQVWGRQPRKRGLDRPESTGRRLQHPPVLGAGR